MSDEWELFKRGPVALLAAARADAPWNWSVLAQSCAREARAADDDASACAWAEAGIVCYEAAAAKLEDKVTRQGRSMFAYALRAMCILRWNAGTERARVLLDECVAWVAAGIAEFGEPAEFARLLGENGGADGLHGEAILLCERLRTLRVLRDAGLFPPEFEPWCRAAGLGER